MKQMKSAQPKVALIGAGLAGLASAGLLAKRGFEVTVFEKCSRPGGVAGSFYRDGYTFDMGPSWYLMPEVYDDYFSIFGKKTADYYELLSLDPSYRIYFGQGRNVDITRDLEQNAAIFDTFEPGGGEKLKRYLKNSETKYTIAVNEFLYKDYTSIADFFNRRILVDGLKLNIFKKLDTFIGSYFNSQEALEVLSFNTVFLGSSPYKTPALYSLMAHADMTQGVFYPKGGIYKLVEALYKNAEETGVSFRFEAPVTSIVVNNGEVKGVNVDGELFEADIVLSAADYHHTENVLLEEPYRNYTASSWNRRTMAPSTFLMYIGLDKKLPALAHHSFYFTQNWKDNFRQIFEQPDWPTEPSYYLGCSSRTDPTIAPTDGEGLFILVPVAPALEDSDSARETYADKIINHLEHLLDESIRPHIRMCEIRSHRDFIRDFHTYKGASLGMSHTLFQSALFRPSHRSKRVKNLYYTGHYTQPGIGMPMAIIGSKLVADDIEQDLEETPSCMSNPA